MKCLDCQYDLSAITSNKCPECGRLFDASNSSTYCTDTPLPIGEVFDRLKFVAFVATSCSFIVHLLSGYGALVAARVELGHWPHRMGRDDPKLINGLVKILYWVYLLTGGLTVWLMLISVPLILIAAARFVLSRARHKGATHRVKTLTLAAAAISAICMMLHIKFDPAQIGMWMMD